MDNTAPFGTSQTLSAQGKQTQDQTNQNQAAQQPISQPVQQATPVAPVSIPQKEQGPARSASINQDTEFITSSTPEQTLRKEVAEIGVETVPEITPLPQGAQKVGVKLAGEATPVVTQPLGSVQLPKSEGEVKQEMKTQKNPSNSMTWYILLMWRQFKKMHKKLTGG